MGQEKDVVIFSCVRACKTANIGFLDDYRRMNVTITRAKSSILVVGSALTLTDLESREPIWKNLVEHAEKKGQLFKVSKPYTSFFGDKNTESMRVNGFVEPVDMDQTIYGNLELAEMEVEHEDGNEDAYDYDMADGFNYCALELLPTYIERLVLD
ncbi:hypothetical protein Droror1_Dr00018324 [Drosera rotundifolia]